MRLISIISAILFATATMWAQTYVVFRLTDGSVKRYPISAVDSLAFNGLDAKALHGHKCVDMGLSVNWAPVNLDVNKATFEAESPEAWGSYAGWGDPTGKMTSDDNDDYLGYTPPANICGSPNDIARVYWGGAWRLPTYEEFMEFTEDNDMCQRKWTTLNNHHGYNITGPNGNSIFMPAAGFFFKDFSTPTTPADLDVDGGYWTGESFIATDYKARGRYLFFLKDYFGLVFDTRAYRQSVRPCIQKEAMVRYNSDQCTFIPIDMIERITFE